MACLWVSDLIQAQASLKPPQFLVRAVKGPVDANLDRVQMVKGWLDAEGQQQEQVYNIVWSGDRALDSRGRLPAVGNSVDLTTGRYSNNIGQGPSLLRSGSTQILILSNRHFTMCECCRFPPRAMVYSTPSHCS